jgi:hypothetical protein
MFNPDTVPVSSFMPSFETAARSLKVALITAPIRSDAEIEAALVAEVKSRKNGSGFTLLEKWLGDYQALFLRRNRADPLVVLPWSTWVTLLEKVRRS